MKNPHITTVLNSMMADEKKQRLEAIGTIIEHKLVRNPQTDANELFNTLYELDIAQLNDMLSDIISEIYAECNKFVTGS
jgi:hypothetical protein